MKSNAPDREYDKFRSADNGQSKVAVTPEDPFELTSAQFDQLNKEVTQLEVRDNLLDINQNTLDTVVQLVAANTSLDNLEILINAIKTRLETFSLNTGLSNSNTLRTASNVYGIDDQGNLHQALVNRVGNLALNGVRSSPSNLNPSSVGIVAHERQANPQDSHQTQRLTSVTSGNVRALDISLHDENGNPYDEDNRLAVTSIDYLDTQLLTGAKTVGATQVLAAVSGSNLSVRKSLAIYNNGTINVYYGGSGVTVATGIPIIPQGSATFDVFETVDIFLIASSNTEVRIAEAK